MNAHRDSVPRYRGRFAPSPTGPLHFGSLVAALASWLDARHHDGEWLLRMEDLDTPRNVPGTADDILRTLESYGLNWDGEVTWQSKRNALYEAAFETLRRSDAVFACACSRKEIADSVLNRSMASGEVVYPGTCRHGLQAGREPRAWRVRVDDIDVAFDDAIQGRTSQQLTREVGDFVVRRADGPFAYQLAVVVDDDAQGITHVVRGADLLDSTPRQIYLQLLLGMQQPHYAHLPAASNAAGEKLSKQTRARALGAGEASHCIHFALKYLGQQPPEALAGAPVREVLDWACLRWALSDIPSRRSQPVPDSY